MHAIKKAARREAWYTEPDDDEGTAYRVFRRINAGPRTRTRILHGDEVSRMHHVATENDAMDPTEHRRRRSYQDIYSTPATLHRSHSLSELPADPFHGLTTGRESLFNAPVEKSHKDTDTPAEIEATRIEETNATNLDGSKRRPLSRFKPWRKSDDSPQDEEDQFERKKKKKPPHFTLGQQLHSLFGAWLHVLLCFVPAGFAVNYTHQPPVTVFVINFFAIIPLASILKFSSSELALYVGDTLGGLFSMSTGNAVQLISSIFLLKSRQLKVLRSSLLGSILQNLLLMTGLSFLFGGLNRMEQFFNVTVAQTTAMFLLLAVLSLTIPTVSQIWGHSTHDGILAQSRGTAVVIMFSYLLWLFFQLKTHRAMFEEPSMKSPKKASGKKIQGEASKAIAITGRTATLPVNSTLVLEDECEDEETPHLSKTTAVVAIAVSATLLAFITEFATNSIKGLMENKRLSESFMGIVILPLLSNDPETIACGIKDKMDLALSLTLHRSMQTALMVVPLIVLIAWGLDIDGMTLDFDGFSVAALFASILIVAYVIQDGKSNWLTGALLVKVFVIISLASFYIE